MDKRVFVFCIGGTGLRVMKSITMLMASGMSTNGYTVVPIIIDPHLDLDEKKNLNNLIDDYIKIYNSTIKDSQSMNPLDGFFHSEIKKLKEISNQQNDLDESVAKAGSFGSYIGESKLEDGDMNRYFLQTLYSQSNLDNSLSVGFKGNPNVGSVVLGNMIENANWFEQFKRHCNEEDRIFIISSIFGGTGASGFPLIEKKIREAIDLPNVNKALMGAVSVLPYYELEDPKTTKSDIDSTSFITKAKSALAYYADNDKGVDYLYYVGENSKANKQTYANNEQEQKDKAHFIELVSASALFDFLEREKPENKQYLSRSIKEDQPAMDKVYLGDGYNEIVKHVADFMLLNMLVGSLPNEKYFPLIKDRAMDDNFYKSDAYISLTKFTNDYKNWYEELATNVRSFSPLNNDNTKSLNNWIKGMTIDCKDDSYFLLEMIKASNKEKVESHTNTLRYFLKFAYQAINNYTKVME